MSEVHRVFFALGLFLAAAGHLSAIPPGEADASRDLPVPKGMRAFSIKAKQDATSVGFVMPGSRVDLLTTKREGDKTTTKVIFANVLVLAVDTPSRQEDDAPANIGTITVALALEDAIKLVFASAKGEIGVVLRAPEVEKKDQN